MRATIIYKHCIHQALRPLKHSRSYASRSFTRQERIDEAKFLSQSNLGKIDARFNLFNESVTNVVDIGSAPGTWLEYCRQSLLAIHRLSSESFHRKCTLIGFDLLFCKPPSGTFYTQGNIYSISSHKQVIGLLKESALRRARPQQDLTDEFGDELSYISKELNETKLEAEVQRLSSWVNGLSLTDDDVEGARSLMPNSYQADLVLSDLSFPTLQESGFHNNTQSKPYIRSSSNKMLREPLVNPEKASIDLAEAALLLCGDALRKGGTFVLRLARVDLSDPELLLLESRLLKVFTSVTRWSHNNITSSRLPKTQDLFMICEGKRHHSIDKYDVFDVKC